MLKQIPLVRVISATRLNYQEFFTQTALGQSMTRLARHETRAILAVAFENKAGLAEVFNRAIALQGSEEPDILIFCHDDVRIDDIYFVDHVLEGLKQYDVLGVAGATTIREGQLVWAGTVTNTDPSTFKSLLPTGLLSGAVGSKGQDEVAGVDYFGPVPAECELLDGVFLAVKRSALLKNKICFDTQFEFHFYDLDFCRQVRNAGLRLSTWPISITHEYTTAGYFTQEWRSAANRYINKWGE